jgi:gluconokinase
VASRDAQPDDLGIVVMGVSGSGKTTLGQRLAEALACPFLEGDDFHSAHNLAKMQAGIPLEDADRWPWLESLGEALGAAVRAGGRAVCTCSALKRSYREHLRQSADVPLLTVYLHADPAVLEARMTARVGHFMPASLLTSQLATLEPPNQSEHALSFDSATPVQEMVTQVRAMLPAHGRRRFGHGLDAAEQEHE